VSRGLLLALLLLLPLLSGCFGGAGAPLPPDRLRVLRDQLEEVDRLGRAEIDARLAAMKEEADRLSQTKDRALLGELARKRLLIGYCWERRGDLADARDWYAEAARGEYGSVAYMRLAQVAEYAARESAGAESEEWKKRAVSALEHAANYPVGAQVVMRDPGVAMLQPGVWRVGDLRHEAYSRLDEYYQERLSYRVFDFLVAALGGRKNYSYVLAIVAIAVLAKLITHPLSRAQFRSMQAMQAMQPELKKLQEKYKGDKQQMARAQMELFKKHHINPASSCLPMLIQMPILIWVYYAIRHFVFRFEGVHFLYLKSLADPDVISIGGAAWPGPLLLLYGVSMYFSQKLLGTPAATPEQQQQQKLMMYMMPVLLVVLLKGLPAAFIFYWLLQNILMTGHQYLILRGRRLAEASGTPAAPPRPAPPAILPPREAVEKLTEGSPGQKTERKMKKRKKRRRGR